MKLFISWSGARSQKLAEALRDWLPLVINAVEPWISSMDISAGSRWNNEVAQNLEESKVGIFCLTAENLGSPWIHFEAGAISKTVQSSFACTLLLGITYDQVEWPLAQFQAKLVNKKQIQELVQAINLVEKPVLLREDHLLRAFEKWWPELQEKIDAIPLATEDQAAQVGRSPESLLTEILGLLRTQERSIDRQASSLQGSQSNKQIPPRSYIHPSALRGTIRRMDDIRDLAINEGLTAVSVDAGTEGLRLRGMSGKRPIEMPVSDVLTVEDVRDLLKQRLVLAQMEQDLRTNS